MKLNQISERKSKNAYNLEQFNIHKKISIEKILIPNKPLNIRICIYKKFLKHEIQFKYYKAKNKIKKNCFFNISLWKVVLLFQKSFFHPHF